MAKTREVPGLREALAGLAEAEGRRDGLMVRIQQAKADLELRQRDRTALLARMTAGEAVPDAELLKAGDAVRRLEDGLVLLGEAATGAETAVTVSQRAVDDAVGGEARRWTDRLREEHAAAERGYAAAREEMKRAHAALEVATRGGWQHDPAFRAVIDAHRPVLARAA